MILEIAMLQIIPGQTAAFETAFAEAKFIISAMPGFVSLELQKCLERPDRYALLVRWQTVEHHTEGFRRSLQYQRWKALLHHFYDPFPEVEHFQEVVSD